MSRPEYLCTYAPYMSNELNGAYKVTGDTEKYWKCLINNGSGDTFLVNKQTMYQRGTDIKYVAKTKEEVLEWRKKVRLRDKFRRIDYRKLSVEQLESIIKIVEEKENEIQSTKHRPFI